MIYVKVQGYDHLPSPEQRSVLNEVRAFYIAMNYQSEKWKRKRERILRRDGYQCQISRRYGKFVEAQVVHHIFPAEDYPEYEWSDWNLISVSLAVHNKLHIRDTRELSREGIDLMRRTARKRGLKLD